MTTKRPAGAAIQDPFTSPKLTTSWYLPKSSRKRDTKQKKYEPNTPQTLWTQGPINSMNLRPQKLYEPKTPKIV